MFNVCPVCGLYDADRIVTDTGGSGHGLSHCGSCGAATPFRQRPLFVVTGASGTGKTSTCLNLMQRELPYLALESDIMWGSIPVHQDEDLDHYWNTWLRLIKNIHQGDRSVILCGTVTPDRLEKQQERRYVGKIHYLALVTDPDEHRQRLMDRPAWRESSHPEFVEQHVSFNKWLIDNAEVGEPAWSVLNTTGVSVKESADAILEWVGAQD